MTKTREILSFLRKNAPKEKFDFKRKFYHHFHNLDDFLQFMEMVGENEFQVKICISRQNFVKYYYNWKGREIKTFPSKLDKSLAELI